MTTPPPNQDPFTALVLAIFQANGAMLAWGDRFTAPFGLTSARWQMLGGLALSGEPLSSPRLAQTMGVTRQGAQKQLNLLLDDGLIERLPNPAHTRSPLYQLSAQGRARYQQVDAHWRAHAHALAKGAISHAQLQAAQQVLAQVAALHALEED